MLAHTAEPMGRVAPTAAQPKVSYLALPRRKARKASQRHRLSPMSLQANLDAKSARVPRNDLRKVPVSVDTRRRAACATRRRALARAAPSRPSSHHRPAKWSPTSWNQKKDCRGKIQRDPLDGHAVRSASMIVDDGRLGAQCAGYSIFAPLDGHFAGPNRGACGWPVY